MIPNYPNLNGTRAQTRELRRKLRVLSEMVILYAETVESALQNNPYLQNIGAINRLDPERTRVERHYADKILAAIETDSYIDPEWLDRIGKSVEE